MSALTYQDVLDILRLIDSGSFSEIEVEFEGTRVKVTRPSDGAASVPAQNTAAPAAPEPARKSQSAPAKAAAKPMPQPSIDVPDGIAVKPPMAGTFYCSPSPGAPPFVDVGRPVRKGEQLGLVEVMKLFTAVVSPCDGIVRAILVANEQFVDSDQTLMIVEAA